MLLTRHLGVCAQLPEPPATSAPVRSGTCRSVALPLAALTCRCIARGSVGHLVSVPALDVSPSDFGEDARYRHTEFRMHVNVLGKEG